MISQTRHSWFVALGILLFLPSMCYAGRFSAAPRPPIEGYHNPVGGKVSIGMAGKNDADSWGLEFGFGHGLWDDDKPKRDFKSRNSVGACVALRWAFDGRSRHSFNLTPTVEYEFDADAWNISVDLGYFVGF